MESAVRYMSDKMNLYHGSVTKVSKLEFGFGNPYNDYGLGFYTTPSFEMAAEWSVPTPDENGFVNEYEVRLKDLSILHLDELPFEYWVSVLMQNRGGLFNREVNQDMVKFIKKYPMNLSSYDVVCGYRADDAYFSFVRDFCLNILSLENLQKAMYLGDLGIQYCLLSEKAFEKTTFIKSTDITAKVYHQKRIKRDDVARNRYLNMPNKRVGTLLLDIIGR